MSTARLSLNILVVIGVLMFLAHIRAGVDPGRPRPGGTAQAAWQAPGGVPATAPARFLSADESGDWRIQIERAERDGAAVVVEAAPGSDTAQQLIQQLPAELPDQPGGFKLVYVGPEDGFRRLAAEARPRGIDVQWVPLAED